MPKRGSFAADAARPPGEPAPVKAAGPQIGEEDLGTGRFSRKDPEHFARGQRRNGARRRPPDAREPTLVGPGVGGFGQQAAEAGTTVSHDQDLAAERSRARMDQRHRGLQAKIVEQVFVFEAVGAVEHASVIGHERRAVVAVQAKPLHADSEALGHDIDLRTPHVVVVEKDLPVEVLELDLVGIDEGKARHAGAA